MTHTPYSHTIRLFILLFLLRLYFDVSCDGVKTEDTHVPDDIPPPDITRYRSCTGASSPKCIILCSVSSVAQAQLSWYNGSVSVSSLTISDFNTKLYLEVEHQDKNNYSCVVSSSGTNQTTPLNITHICQPCPDKSTTMMTVGEGENLTLPTNITELQNEDIQWLYEGNAFIAKIYENTTTLRDCNGGRFTNRLQLDSQTGSLTITNISKTQHFGHYKLLITNGPHTECQSYDVTVFERTTTVMSVSEGENLTLPTNLTQLQDEDIQWLYEGNVLIAEVYRNQTSFPKYDGRFSNRLQLDNKIGSLTINIISKVHSGLYDRKVINVVLKESHRFNVTVYDLLPSPVITNNSTQCSSASKDSKCVVLCSVNVTHVTLSWYNGSRLHSSISVSDLKRNFLCLEVEYQDTNIYSCVVNNSFNSKTTGLNITELCKDHRWQLIIGVLSSICVITVVVLVCWLIKRFICQQDVSGDQLQARYTSAAQPNGASGEGTSVNTPHEGTRLIFSQSSQESMPSSQLCCKMSPSVTSSIKQSKV